MNNYSVIVNNHREQRVQAGNSRVAVNNAMRGYKESEFKPAATIIVKFISKVEYCFEVVADVPFDYGVNGQGTSRKTVSVSFDDKGAADVEAKRLEQEHPDWHFVKAVKRQKK